MTDFTPTDEQVAIINAAKNTTDNLLINALAGAAKTSTLVLMSQALKNKAQLCLAFNKSIQLEMQERLPSTAIAKTLNGLGHGAWATQIGRRLTLNKSKTYDLMSLYIKEKLRSGEQQEAYDSMSELIKAVDAGKTAGYIPTGRFPQAHGLMNDIEFFNWLDLIVSPLQERIIREVTSDSITLGFDHSIDFNDQILLPTVFPATFTQYPIVMVDETQDLSSLNHAMLNKIAKKRLIAVGDPCQAIYGFRGAHENSMELLQQQFDMKEMELTISFRCPKEVVKVAQKRAPQMQWPDWAKEGKVQRLFNWSVDDLPQNVAIICRNNAPIFSLASKLLREGLFPTIKGNDIGKLIIKYMKKLGKSDLPQVDVYTAIHEWEEKAKKKARNHQAVTDKADIMLIFAENGQTLGEAIAYGQHLINSSGTIHMMTGHKSKGLEYDHVFLLDTFLLDDKGQDVNLRYVMETRAMDSLTYVDSSGFEETKEQDNES